MGKACSICSDAKDASHGEVDIDAPLLKGIRRSGESKNVKSLKAYLAAKPEAQAFPAGGALQQAVAERRKSPPLHSPESDNVQQQNKFSTGYEAVVSQPEQVQQMSGSCPSEPSPQSALPQPKHNTPPTDSLSTSSTSLPNNEASVPVSAYYPDTSSLPQLPNSFQTELVTNLTHSLKKKTAPRAQATPMPKAVESYQDAIPETLMKNANAQMKIENTNCDEKMEEPAKVFVGNLPREVKDIDLVDFLYKATGISVPGGFVIKRPRYSKFRIAFSKEELPADDAIELIKHDRLIFNGRELKIARARHSRLSRQPKNEEIKGSPSNRTK